MKLFSKLNLLTLALGGVLVLSVPAVKADTTADTNNQQSTATLNIQDESSDITAKLSLDAVPSFPFGTVKAGTIFSGQSVDQGLTNNNNVVVTDTRLSNIGWNLAVTNTTAFVNGDSKINGTIQFTPSAFQFSDGAAEGWTWSKAQTSLELPSSVSNQVATSTGAKKGTATSTIQSATLKFNGHDAIVPGSYTANLTWNLTAATKDSSIKSE
ncbi:WxL domain-containing protein [Ligilactobacillus salivarius]|uniref:WxL domain-containing protein n=1 Tax=Ligilactobacillus salivarius TaxID=1624 RepID=UPI003C2C7503